MGVQFHPEVTSEIVGDWARAYGSRMNAYGITAASLAAECDKHAPSARARAYELLDAFAERGNLLRR
jgi:GMP synthase-like glutamine amidotransferase